MANPANKAGRIPTPPTAFSHDLRSRTKRPRAQMREHLSFIRGLPCLVCGTRRGVQAAHIRARSAIYGKRSTGIGEKPSDCWTLPVCAHHHAMQHEVGDELLFWRIMSRADPFAVALALFAASGDEDRGELIIAGARK